MKDTFQGQINIPKEKRDIAAQEGINTENEQKVTVQIVNLKTGETYTGRLPITGNRQIYVPTEIQQMLEGAGKIRLQILGGKNAELADLVQAQRIMGSCI